MDVTETAPGLEVSALDAADSVDRSDPLWYKDAIIYQLHIKAFQDSNNDGIGDFQGLMERLDYVQDLGVTTLWILPFYPSPLRDDGYDISDYRAINPSYGTMRDFRRFVAAAHRRGLRVITELVINHTSDQHPWFQKARHAPPGSAARNFYVWSNTDKKYDGTRIIFLDTEKSNWTWDPVAQAYFWHRFYSHQPDLNFDNPRVLKEVLKVMRMWLDMGVDGLRLDAIPYLVERDGTNNENLPETHVVLKKIRAELDAQYTDRMLLAEANQWPEDTRPYFGDGDECHMGFHFPLMPRMYMALAQEDRHPITDIIRQTPEIPPECQWAIFLRNHDEVTLEMVTEEERDYLWETYAADHRARINLGIRRRLAPLMQNDRRKIELMNALLLSMPGTPIIYYGDELGMGDNYYLGDRDGVRTPMQWSADRNGGFSRANPQQLYLPPIMDPVYGYQTVNVEAQHSEPSSLLNWMRRIVAVRKQHPAFGRGELTFLYPRNRKILAYVRSFQDETILCVVNLARSAQAVELDLSRFRGAVPVELLGRSAFPPVGDLPYMLTLPAYGFYWFVLGDEAALPRWHAPTPDPLPEFVTLTVNERGVLSALEGREKRILEADVLPQFLPLQRWFAGKDQAIRSVTIVPVAPLDERTRALTTVEVQTADGTAWYFLPLAVRWGEENLRRDAPKLFATLTKVRKGPRVGVLLDAAQDEAFAIETVHAMREEQVLAATEGTVRFSGSEALREIQSFEEVRPLAVEQSNLSIALDDQVLLKLYRHLRGGEQPDVEVARFLTRQGYTHTPAWLGDAVYQRPDEDPVTLLAAFSFVRNQGDAWAVVTAALHRHLEEITLLEHPEAPESYAFPLGIGALLGTRTAELHRVLAGDSDDDAFAPEPVSAADISAWAKAAREEADAILAKLRGLAGDLPQPVADDVAQILAAEATLMERIEAAQRITPAGLRTRIHGDYHLGQVLIVQDNVMIIDFEGEPQRTLAERRRKTSPLRDVAGMIRSFDYAAFAALDRLDELASQTDLPHHAVAWRDITTADFLAAYHAGLETTRVPPDDPAAARQLLDLFTLQKALYEIGYEAANRPKWLSIPARGLLRLLEDDTTI